MAEKTTRKKGRRRGTPAPEKTPAKRRTGRRRGGKTAAVEIRRMKLSELKEHPENEKVRKHPEPGSPDWEALKKSLAHDYFDPLCWNEKNGMLVSGHLRRKILMAEGYAEADVVVVRYTEKVHRSRMLAANRASGEFRFDGFTDFLKGADAELTAFPAFEIEEFMPGPEGEEPGSGDYTMKVEAPVYEPRGDRPDVAELTDGEKVEALVEEIDASGLPDEEKAFLRMAAQRHRVFNYQKAAEYYCHATAEAQRLMEKSALVIIDFDDAIANGYVTLTEELRKLYAEEVKKRPSNIDAENETGEKKNYGRPPRRKANKSRAKTGKK